MWSGALFRGDGGKRGPALLDVLAAAVRTGDLFLLMPSNGQGFQKAPFFVVRRSRLAGERRLAAGNGHSTASAKIVSAGTGFRSHCRRARQLGLPLGVPCVTCGSRRLNDAFPAIPYRVVSAS